MLPGLPGTAVKAAMLAPLTTGSSTHTLDAVSPEGWGAFWVEQAQTLKIHAISPFAPQHTTPTVEREGGTGRATGCMGVQGGHWQGHRMHGRSRRDARIKARAR